MQQTQSRPEERAARPTDRSLPTTHIGFLNRTGANPARSPGTAKCADPARLRRAPTRPEASTSSSRQHPSNCSLQRQSGSAHKGLARASPAGDKLTKQAKILTPKSPVRTRVRARTHVQTKFRARSHGHNGCTRTRAASRSSTPWPTPSRTAGNWVGRKLSWRRWDGGVVATEGKGRFKRQRRKGLPD